MRPDVSDLRAAARDAWARLRDARASGDPKAEAAMRREVDRAECAAELGALAAGGDREAAAALERRGL